MNDIFWYLKLILQSDRGINEDVSCRIRAECVKWRYASDILCEKKILNKLKGKFYMMTIRLAMMYVVERWATKG
jgi:hypothetical protein